ncbi:MAG: FAD-dependent oxidoreductase, partial [Candidatus Nanopelagicales bacterium]
MSSRDQTIAALDEEIDVIIVGGGINGAVSAAALAAHGVRVVLLEANDFASMTSQESSNMIWGGIKYLQDYEFSLVWALCRSRNQLLKKYPNRVKQIPFFAVIGPTSPFSRWLGFLGSILYWFFG